MESHDDDVKLRAMVEEALTYEITDKLHERLYEKNFDIVAFGDRESHIHNNTKSTEFYTNAKKSHDHIYDILKAYRTKKLEKIKKDSVRQALDKACKESLEPPTTTSHEDGTTKTVINGESFNLNIKNCMRIWQTHHMGANTIKNIISELNKTTSGNPVSLENVLRKEIDNKESTFKQDVDIIMKIIHPST